MDSQLNRQYGGTGWGWHCLATLRAYHGGDITVTSVIGSGSRFTLYLPDHQVPASRPLATVAPPAVKELYAQPWTPQRVLIVEDDPCSAIVLQDYLQAFGHEVEH